MMEIEFSNKGGSQEYMYLYGSMFQPARVGAGVAERRVAEMRSGCMILGPSAFSNLRHLELQRHAAQ